MRLLEAAGMAVMRKIDPEIAHHLALKALTSGLVPMRDGPVTSPRLKTHLAGLALANPVGLAAGFDKNAVAIAALSRAGFGWLEVGAATPLPQPGNPKPRLFRLPEHGAVINRFGFNNDGAALISERLSSRPRTNVPVGLNIGANKHTLDKSTDYAKVVASAGAYCDFLTVNVSSPNTEKLTDLQAADALARILIEVNSARDSLATRPAIFLKISPDLDEGALGDLAAVALEYRVDAVIATNTTQDRPDPGARHASQAGGLSGKPLMAPSTRILARLAKLTDGKVPLVGVGGISSVDDIWEKLRAGASAVQLYTALAYQGLSLAADLATQLDQRLKHAGIDNATQLVGTGIDEWV